MTMKPETRFTLGTRNEIANALVSVSGQGHLVDHLYPRIMDLADTEQVATGLAFFLSVETDDYLNRLSSDTQAHRTAARLFVMSLPHQFGRALIKDGTAREEFLDVLAQIGLPTGREVKGS